MLLNLLFAAIFLAINIVALLNFVKLFQMASGAARRFDRSRQKTDMLYRSVVDTYSRYQRLQSGQMITA